MTKSSSNCTDKLWTPPPFREGTPQEGNRKYLKTFSMDVKEKLGPSPGWWPVTRRDWPLTVGINITLILGYRIVERYPNAGGNN